MKSFNRCAVMFFILQKIMQEERSKNRILLGSIQSLYVESVLDTDIKIAIQQPLKGWKVGYIKPQVKVAFALPQGI